MRDSRPEPQRLPASRLWVLPSWLLNQVASQANKLVADAFGRPGARRRYAVLAGLAEFGPISQAELGRRLGLDRSDLVAELDILEGDGLALRTPDAVDQRRNALRITPAGAAALDELDIQVHAAQETLLEGLSAAEREQLVLLLQRVLTHHVGFRA